MSAEGSSLSLLRAEREEDRLVAQFLLLLLPPLLISLMAFPFEDGERVGTLCCSVSSLWNPFVYAAPLLSSSY